jgi:hypothetical protein
MMGGIRRQGKGRPGHRRRERGGLQRFLVCSFGRKVVPSHSGVSLSASALAKSGTSYVSACQHDCNQHSSFGLWPVWCCAASVAAYNRAVRLHMQKKASVEAARQKALEKQQKAASEGSSAGSSSIEVPAPYYIPLRLLNNAAVMRYRWVHWQLGLSVCISSLTLPPCRCYCFCPSPVSVRASVSLSVSAWYAAGQGMWQPCAALYATTNRTSTHCLLKGVTHVHGLSLTFALINACCVAGHVCCRSGDVAGARELLLEAEAVQAEGQGGEGLSQLAQFSILYNRGRVQEAAGGCGRQAEGMGVGFPHAAAGGAPGCMLAIDACVHSGQAFIYMACEPASMV